MAKSITIRVDESDAARIIEAALMQVEFDTFHGKPWDVYKLAENTFKQIVALSDY
jgi:hypothetical protein